MSKHSTSRGTHAPQDGWGTLNVPRPVKPDPRTVRDLAQAGMSKRGLIVISDRKTAKYALAAQAEREESPLARSPTPDWVPALEDLVPEPLVRILARTAWMFLVIVRSSIRAVMALFVRHQR